MDGFGLAEALKASADFSHIPLIFISSRWEAGFRQKAFEAGAAEYLTKPVHNARLLELLELYTHSRG
jgi:CheY-like chemotaxis protein